jgi:TRAP-type C4-dicarboxylate transport system permease large subunit
VMSHISGLSLEKMMKAILPFLLPLLLVLLVVTYFPDLVLFLPDLLMK